MSPNITIAERLSLAKGFIQKARDLPVPAEGGKYSLSYMAEVKDLLRQARDLIKFIPYQPTATDEIKKQVEALFQEADRANKDILR